ncbi:MAG: diguanylate cyclase [Synergistaceae bacterium]|nr:diguanylate cyclase [Synergistaceae bacterium]
MTNEENALISVDRRQVTRNSVLQIGLYAALWIFVAGVAWWFLRLDAATLSLFFIFGAAALIQFVLFVKEREKARHWEALLTIMTKTTGGCSWIWDLVNRRFRLLPEGRFIFGRDAETYEDFVSLIHPDDVDFFKKVTNHLRSDGTLDLDETFNLNETLNETFNVELRMQSVQGEWRWFVARSHVAVRFRGKIVRLIGAMLDIDDYKRTMEALQSSERRLEMIFRSAPEGMAITDNKGRLLDANQAFYDMLGYSSKELHEVPVLSLSDGHREVVGKVAMEEFLAECESDGDRFSHLEEDFTHRDGRRVTLKYGISPLIDFDGNILNYVFSGIDITLQKKRAAEFKLLSENQHWLFDFLQQFNQFEGVEQLFEALRENLPKVISFSHLKLIVPSFLEKTWFLCDEPLDADRVDAELTKILAGEGPLGRAYVDRTPLAREERHFGEARSVLAVPLAYKGKTWGVMGLENESSNAFTHQDVTLMSILGGNIGIYFEEQFDRTELDTDAQQLQRLHGLIYSMLQTQNRKHLLDEVLKYLENMVKDSACAIYLFDENGKDSQKLKRLAYYEKEHIHIPNSDLVMEAIRDKASQMVYNEKGVETRYVSPLVFQARSIGALDLHKPSGILPRELKMYQLLTDYVSSFWMLYDLMATREEEAFIDPLTGIWNRRYMIRRLQEESDRIARYGGNACLVIGDMGSFKQINDNYGHIKGDEVLVKTVSAIKKSLRLSDSVGRYGGDEFIILLSNVTLQDAEVVLNRIEVELKQQKVYSDDSNPDAPLIEIVMDFGLAIYPGTACSLLETINLADEAMYIKKLARKKRAEGAERM